MIISETLYEDLKKVSSAKGEVVVLTDTEDGIRCIERMSLDDALGLRETVRGGMAALTDVTILIPLMG